MVCVLCCVLPYNRYAVCAVVCVCYSISDVQHVVLCVALRVALLYGVLCMSNVGWYVSCVMRCVLCLIWCVL